MFMFFDLNIMTKEITKIYSDGATEGQNGKLGSVSHVGLGVYIPDYKVWEYKYTKGISNNEAEFKALLYAMKLAIKLKIKNAIFYMDSRIVANRCNGRRPSNKNTNVRMNKFQDQVYALKHNFTFLKFKWIPREQNTQADILSKRALGKL